MTSPSPSWIAEWLLALGYRDRDWADAVVGDLREEFETLAGRHGAAAARRWHWAQALRLSGRRVLGGTPSPTSRRTPMQIGEPRDQGSRFTGIQRDIAYALRALLHRPALTFVMIGALALGLAANAAIFTVLDALVLRPFRFSAVDRLVVAASVKGTEFFDASSVSAADYLEWVEQAKAVTGFTAVQWWEPNLTGHDEPEQLAGFLVTPGFFHTLDVNAIRGRTFVDADGVAGSARRVVISHKLWTRRFAQDPSIVGQTLRLDGEPYEVVGIAPPGFQIPMGADIWCSLAFSDTARTDRTTQNLSVIARLADGADIQSARAELATIVARQREAHPDTNAKRDVTVRTFAAGMGDAGAEQIIAVWQAAALLLLLVACANVLNLLLARGLERQQEFAVRLALGASRGRIVRQLLLEGAMLAGVAVLCAIPLAWLGVKLQQQALPASLIRFVPGWEYVRLEPRALIVAAGLAALATMIFSLAPAAQAARSVVADTLRQGSRTTTAGRRRSWGRATVASAQIALTLALLTGSGLAIGAAYRATRGTLGFDASQVLTARLVLPNNPYDDKVKRTQLLETVLRRLKAVPAVQEAGATSALPYGHQNVRRSFYPEGVTLLPAEAKYVDLRRITPNYLDVMRVPLLQGRPFSTTDTDATQAVALVSRNLAERYWPGADPLQRRFRFAENDPWLTVVGVVGDVQHDWFLDQRNPTVYRPAEQEPPYNVAFVVRTAGDPVSLAGDLRRAITAADPNQPIRELMTMQEVVDEGATGLHYAAQTLSVIGGIALLLALMGIYSLMSYLASRRTQEIGVRMAFGATRGDVVRLTLRQAAGITIAGLVAGVALAFGLSWAMQSLMFGAVTSSLSLPFALAALLAVAALAASYLPARRAAGLDPTVALRAE